MMYFECSLCKDTGKVDYFYGLVKGKCPSCEERRKQEEKIFAEKLSCIRPTKNIFDELTQPSYVKLPVFYPVPRIRKYPNSNLWLCMYKLSWEFGESPAEAYSKWKANYNLGSNF